MISKQDIAIFQGCGDKRSALGPSISHPVNTKFKLKDVFVGDEFDDDPTQPVPYEKMAEVFTAIWPKWRTYFKTEVNKLNDLELDSPFSSKMCYVSVCDCYKGVDNMIDIMFDNIYLKWNWDEPVSLVEIIDKEIEEFDHNCLDNLDQHELFYGY